MTLNSYKNLICDKLLVFKSYEPNDDISKFLNKTNIHTLKAKSSV